MTMQEGRENSPIAFVVDDDLFIRMDAAVTLMDAGFNIIEAESGDDALRKLERGPIELIELLFTDVQMPGKLNGFALAREVAARWPKIGIIVASGMMKPKQGDLPEGATFIDKPFSPEVVHDHLLKVLPPERRPKPLQESDANS